MEAPVEHLWPLEKRVRAVQLYYRHQNYREAARQMRAEFNDVGVQDTSVRKVVMRFCQTGSVAALPRSGRPSIASDPDFQQRVREQLTAGQPTSTRRLALQLNEDEGPDGPFYTCHETVWRTLKLMKLKPFRPRLVQALHPEDYVDRVQFAELFLAAAEVEVEWVNRVLWSDEAIFKLNGSVNRHNCVYWEEENPQVTIERELNLPGVVVWAGIWSGGLVGPYFFPGTVTQHSYLDMLRDYLLPRIAPLVRHSGLHLQQDGAAPHYARTVRDWLNSEDGFAGQWIGRGGPLLWPPRSPDLTPCDFFLWGVVKEKVCLFDFSLMAKP